MNPEELKELLDKIKAKAESFYNGINDIDCPYLNRKVNFNAKGLDHIKMKAWNKTRTASDQYLRLKFLKLVPEILTASGTIQEIHVTKNFERVRSSGNWQFAAKDVTYYAFVAILRNVKLKVVIKQIESGQPYFWSVMPFWKSRKDPLYLETKKVFHEGDLECD